MSNTNTGGPAFPASYYTDDGQWAKRDGMTLRDYFAAKALQGFIGTGMEGGMIYDQVAEVAYMYADAMLKARDA